MRQLMYNITGRIRIAHVVIIWLAVNMISACLTQLYSDEAYYALFANQLDLGYFDHPPMIALMIRIGLFFFRNELGVRLLSVIAVSAALFFTYRLADVNKPVLFLAAIFSIFGLNILGFIALPDSPLLLFTVLFFLAYKRFLLRESMLNSILLGFVMAALLYSKYHGILILLFTVLSNVKLLRSKKFWYATIFGILLFTPHLIWQYRNDFISISYHFFERSASHYKFSFTYEYFLGQVLYYGPFSAIFMFFAAIKFRQSNLFEKALLWNLWGIIVFFLLSSLKGRVEVNWTFPIIIPLLIFFLKYSVTKPSFTKWFYFSAIPVIIIISMLRLEVVNPVFNLRIDRISDLRGHKEFGKEIIDKCEGLPVITNSYQKAGIVSFYAHTFTPSININSRRNQFNLWHADDSLRFHKVAYINNYLDEGIKIRNPEYKDYKITIIDSLPVMNDIIITTGSKKLKVNMSETVDIQVSLVSQKTPENYRDAGYYTTRLYAGIYGEDNLLSEQVCMLPVDLLLIKNKGKFNFQFKAPSEKGRYHVVVSLKTSGLGAWSTKKTVKLIVR
jgi:hypothetical protein